MKTMKFFKKPALLLSIVVLAALLAVAAIAGVGYVANGDGAGADLGEELVNVSASTSGKIRLNFYYTTYGSATEFVAEVTDPDTGDVTTQTFAVGSLEQNNNGAYRVPVALAPSEMTHSVKVYAKNGDVVSNEAVTYSVAQYAKDVLADASKAEYHDAMRALLNWGTMAQSRFGDATKTPANAGIFVRNSNPIFNLNSISAESGSLQNGTTITGDTMNFELSADNNAFIFYVNYTGEGELTATVAKDGGEAKETRVEKVAEGRYRVKIVNVSPNLFNTPYTVTITDGNDTFVAKKAVVEYLSVLLAQCNDDGNLSTGNVVRAMYQLYQITAGETGADTCTHGRTNFIYWAAAGNGTAYVKCSKCFTEIGHQAISDSVNTYAPATTLTYTSTTGFMDKELMSENGVQFVRFDNFYANRDNWGDIGFSFDSQSGVFTGNNTGVTGQYLVIKYRVGTIGNGMTKMDIYANTNKVAGKTNLVGAGEAGFVKVNDNQWHTVVIDLANLIKDPSVAFVDNGDGTYSIKYLSIRPFGGATTVTEDKVKEDKRYLYTYSYTDAQGKTQYVSNPGAPLSEGEITEKGYTLYRISEQTVAAEAYVDLSYLAICDSLEDAKTLLDCDEYEWVIGKDKNLSQFRNPIDDTCTRHQNAVTSAAGEAATVYTSACKACGTVAATQTVPNSINYFAAYDSMNVYAATGSITRGLDEDGVIFNRFTLSGGCHVNITGGGAAGNPTSATYTTGKYVTLKYRWSNEGGSIALNLATGDKKDGNGHGSGEQASENTPKGEWRVAIVDVSGNQEWTSDGSAQKIYAMLTTGGKGTLDIAYFAVVDSIGEALTLMGEDDEVIYDYVTNFGNTSPIIKDREGNCLHRGAAVTESFANSTYSYICSQCGEALITRELPESVEVYFSPYNMSKTVQKAENNKLTPNTYYHMTSYGFKFDGTPYFTYKGYSDNVAQFIWMRSEQDTANASAHERWYIDMDQAKYIVIKARASADALNDLAFNFSTSGYKGVSGVKVPMSAAGAEEWGVYVVDMSKVLSTHYVKNAETDTYELDYFFFHMSNFSTSDRIDLAYIAFVEDWAGVDAIVDEDTVYNVTDTTGAYKEINTADQTCVGEHDYAVKAVDGECRNVCTACGNVGEAVAHTYAVQGVNGECRNVCTICSNVGDVADHDTISMKDVDGIYKFTCDRCGFVSRDTGVKVDAVGLYWSAEELYRRSTASSQTASTEGAYWTGGPANQYLLTEDGETFLRISDLKTNSQWGGWFPINSGGGYQHPGSGRYMVIKVRQNDNSINSTSIPFWITSAGSSNSWDKGSFSVALPEDNQWHVIVVDLAERAAGYTTDTNGEYGIKTVHLRPFGGYTAMDAATDEVMDIAYIAFFDDLANIKDIVSDETYEISQSNTTSKELYTETDECVVHTPVYTADADDARGYHYECSYCGKEFALDYYESGKGGAYGDSSGRGGKAEKLTDPAGFGYVSFTATGDGGSFLNYNANNNGGGGVSDYAVRAGRYLVMKIRGNTAADVTIRIGTDDFPKKNNNYQGGLAGTFTVDSMPKAWTVVIVDLQGLDFYSLGGTHKIFMSSTSGGGTLIKQGAQIDIAYITLFNEFADIESFVKGEDVKYYGTVLGSTPTDIHFNCETDGHMYDCIKNTAEDGTVTYTYSCVMCGVSKVQTVSNEINYFTVPSNTLNFQASANLGVMDSENGVYYTHYTFGDKTGSHINITGPQSAGSAGSGGPTAESYKPGNYIVIKLRTNVSTFSINVGTANASGQKIGIGETNKLTDEWQICVVSLEKAASIFDGLESTPLYIMFTTSTVANKGQYLDIAYVAIVDTLDEARSLLIDGETYMSYGNSLANTPAEVDQNGKCVGACSFVANGESFVCSGCGYVVVAYRRENTNIGDHTNYSIHNNNGVAGSATTNNVDPVTGELYARLSANPDSTSSTIQGRQLIGGGTKSYINYMILRYRVGEVNEGQECMTFYFNVQDEAHSLRIPVTNDGKWHTIVVDLKAYVGDGTVYTEGYIGGTSYFRPFGDLDGATVRELGAYVDYAYVIGCETLDGSVRLLGTETYEWFDGENVVIRDSKTHQVVAD